MKVVCDNGCNGILMSFFPAATVHIPTLLFVETNSDQIHQLLGSSCNGSFSSLYENTSKMSIEKSRTNMVFSHQITASVSLTSLLTHHDLSAALLLILWPALAAWVGLQRSGVICACLAASMGVIKKKKKFFICMYNIHTHTLVHIDKWE